MSHFSGKRCIREVAHKTRSLRGNAIQLIEANGGALFLYNYSLGADDMPRIVSVCGIPGSGKTTLISNAIAVCADADSFHAFEEYSRVSDFPKDIKRWLATGANPDEWRSAQLVKDLERLQAGNSFTLPAGNRDVRAAGTVFVEDFFGRKRTMLAPFFDLVVHVNIPPEIGLARRLLRDINRGPYKEDSIKARDYIEGFCGRYLDELRELYAVANKCSIDHADLTLDGTTPTKELTTQLLRFLATQNH